MLPLIKKKRKSRGKTIAWLLLCVCVVYLFADIPVFAEYVYARGVTRFLSFIINRITNPVPISFYEVTAALLIFCGVSFAVIEIIFLCKKKFRRFVLWLYRLAVVVLCVLLAFGLLYAPLYNRRSVNSALGLEINAVTEEDVYAAANYFIERLNEVSAKLERDENGDVVATHTFSETAVILNDEYDKIGGSYFSSYDVNPKRVALSVAMSYLGITGIYFPFYAESNVNINIPSYQFPVTMAHEMAHAKGVAVEGEANIAAYVVCICSDDAYISYSGLMYAALNLVNNSGDYQSELYYSINKQSRTEYSNASSHFAKYEGWLDDLSSFFNDLFLKSNGVSSGTKSYGETTQSIVALYYSLI
ncbi:MAG: DUF3810 domain-containing protein [Clostridia bacterium]|nr:DUF3810 domain-containing protein [Clostridia bacterium]